MTEKPPHALENFWEAVKLCQDSTVYSWGRQLYNVQGDPNLLSPLAKLSREAIGPASNNSVGLDTIIRKRELAWGYKDGQHVPLLGSGLHATLRRGPPSVECLVQMNITWCNCGYLYLFPSWKLSPSIDLFSLSSDGFISISGHLTEDLPPSRQRTSCFHLSNTILTGTCSCPRCPVQHLIHTSVR